MGRNQDLATFLFNDFGSLRFSTMQTNALPWKMVAASLLIKRNRENKERLPISQSSFAPLFSKYGFITHNNIKGWEDSEDVPKKEGMPLGLARGFLTGKNEKWSFLKVEVVNISCSTCHAGTNYDSSGAPSKEIVPGLPNTSINLESYVRDVGEALYESVKNKDSKRALFETMEALFPEMDRKERRTLKLLYPIVKKKIRKLFKKYGGVVPFSNGGAGLTNGVASIKNILHAKPYKEFDNTEASFTSIPDLSYRQLRTSLLWDGTYTYLGNDEGRFKNMLFRDVTEEHKEGLSKVISFFLVPTTGQRPKTIPESFSKVRKVMDYLGDYSGARFPGEIDYDLASQGHKTYSQSCAKCHGDYDFFEGEKSRIINFPNKLVLSEKIKTDERRSKHSSTGDILEKLQKSTFKDFVSPLNTGGYVAPMLNGLWATAPYLHNGSVPTLWHLMGLEPRPKKFMVGGHSLDFQKMGLRGELSGDAYVYPSNYTPWSAPEMYDTTALGRDNRGHTRPFEGLSKKEKLNLIEFLKTL